MADSNEKSLGFSADTNDTLGVGDLISTSEAVHVMYGSPTEPVLNGETDIVNEYVYTEGNVTINNYTAWENIDFHGNMQDWVVVGNDFVVNANEGSLRITNAKDKLMEFRDSDNDIIMHALVKEAGGTFDGTSYNELVVVNGANDQSDILIAGSGGSELWGGAGFVDDELWGGAGVDIFTYKYGNGNDFVYGAENNDIINLDDISSGDIRGAEFKEYGVLLVFKDYGSLNVVGDPTTITTTDGTISLNHSNRTAVFTSNSNQ